MRAFGSDVPAYGRKRKHTDWGVYSNLDAGAHVRMPPIRSSFRAFLGGNSELDNLIKGTAEGATIPLSGGFGGVQKIITENVTWANDEFTTNFSNGTIGFLICGITSINGVAELKTMVHYIDFPPTKLAGFDDFYTDATPSQVAARMQQELAYAISVQWNKTYPRYQYVQGGGNVCDLTATEVDVYPSPLLRNTGGGYPIIVTATGSGQLCFRSNFEAGYTNDPDTPTTNYYFNIFTPSERFFEAGGRPRGSVNLGLQDSGWIANGASVFGFGKKVQNDERYFDDYQFPGATSNIYNVLNSAPPSVVSASSYLAFISAMKLKQFVCGYMPANMVASRYGFIVSEEVTAKQRRPNLITNAQTSNSTQIIGVQINLASYGNDRRNKAPFLSSNPAFNPTYTLNEFSFDIVDENGQDVRTADANDYQNFVTRAYQYIQAYGNGAFSSDPGPPALPIPFLLLPDATSAAVLRQPDKITLDTPFDYVLMSTNFLLLNPNDIEITFVPTAIVPNQPRVSPWAWISLNTNDIPRWNVKPASKRIINMSAVGF